MVAENCKCYTISTETRMRGLGRNGNISRLLSALDDKSILLLQQIFLDCHDSFSNFRLAVFLSSKWLSMQYKIVMNGRVKGESEQMYTFDVCIHDRGTGELVALGMQNNNMEQKPSENESLHAFLSAVADLHAAHPRLCSACYASVRIRGQDPLYVVKQAMTKSNCGDIDIRLLEYRKTVYFENKT
jgi:hypothetical protein